MAHLGSRGAPCATRACTPTAKGRSLGPSRGCRSGSWCSMCATGLFAVQPPVLCVGWGTARLDATRRARALFDRAEGFRDSASGAATPPALVATTYIRATGACFPSGATRRATALAQPIAHGGAPTGAGSGSGNPPAPRPEARKCGRRKENPAPGGGRGPQSATRELSAAGKGRGSRTRRSHADPQAIVRSLEPLVPRGSMHGGRK